MDYERQWKKTLIGELDVVFVACKAAWPHLVQRGGGSIINFASANAHVALPGSPALAHCAGKGGVLAMTRQLAMEGAPHNIRANTISPALVVTSATQPVLDNVPGFRGDPRSDAKADDQTLGPTRGHWLVRDLSCLGRIQLDHRCGLSRGRRFHRVVTRPCGGLQIGWRSAASASDMRRECSL